MSYKKIYFFLLALVLTVPVALAQSLPALTPPGAIAGFYTRNLAIKKAFFIAFQAEWNRLDFFDSFENIAEEGGFDAEDLQIISDVLNIDLVGREGIFVFYPSGDFFALARPSADRVDSLIALLDRSMVNPEIYRGWKLDRSDDGSNPLLVGHNGELLLLGSQGAVERFLAGDRGIRPPVEGDLVFWVDTGPFAPLLHDPELELPPEVIRSISTFSKFSWALDIQEGGVFIRSRFALDPNQDPELASLLLPTDQAWALDELPKGVSVSSFVFDLPAFGDYVTNYAQMFGVQDLQLDLSAFGDHLAMVDAGTSDPQEALQNSLGNLLFIMETRDSLTAEVTLLSWIQMLAGFSTPEGSGGFRVESLEVAGMPAKMLSVGILGNLYLVSGDDRLYLATSKRALQLLDSGETVGEDAGFRRLAQAYLPASYVSASYTDNRKTLEQIAGLLPLMMMQTVDDPDVQAMTIELTDKYAQFLHFVATRLGPSIGYVQVQGDELIGFGFMEVAW